MIVSWNVRGLNKVYKHKELKMFLTDNNVSMLADIEHRVREQHPA